MIKTEILETNSSAGVVLASHAVVFSGEEGNTTPLKTTAWEASVVRVRSFVPVCITISCGCSVVLAISSCRVLSACSILGHRK